MRWLALLLVGCGPPAPPCDPSYVPTVAECAARVQLECVDRGIPEESCPVLTECDERIERSCPK